MSGGRGGASSRARGGTHHAALDGLRGLAAVSVLLYHAGVTWAGGGFLGVEVFFVLSGFLITKLLIGEWQRSGTIRLRTFWGRRAKRLLPALLVLITAIGVYYAVAPQTTILPGFAGNGVAALLYYSNWHQLAVGTGYFAQSVMPSPFEHTWSLAIEEQFYIVWPIAILAMAAAARRLSLPLRTGLRVLAAVTLLGAVASLIDAAVLFDGGRGLNRVYYGTDTRASGLLVGASLAASLALVRARQTQLPGVAILRPVLATLGGVSLGLIGVGIAVVTGGTSWLYPAGTAALDLLVAIVIAGVVTGPASPAARVLGAAPLRGLGIISYGLYLWHFPLFEWLTSDSTGLAGAPLLLLRLGVTGAVSLASYLVVEQPIRRGRIPRWLVRFLAPAAAAGAAAALMAGSAVAALPTAPPVAPPRPHLAHTGGRSCRINLADTPRYGLAPVAPSAEAHFELKALDGHALTWQGSTSRRFPNCPPTRVLFVGDSLAFTLALPMMQDEQSWGLEIANAALLGCGFTADPSAEPNVRGRWQAQSAGCPDALPTWAAEARSLHASVIVIELGYRDEFDWLIRGHTAHLGQPGFDAGLQARMEAYVRVLGRTGAKLLFLTVPYTDPAPYPDGSPAPAGSPARHAIVNRLLAAAIRRGGPGVHLLDLDRTVSPGNHYDLMLHGQMCRFDGIHFTLYCGALLESTVLPAVAALAG